MTYIRGEHFGSSLAWVLTTGSLLLYGFITINFCSKLKVWACITFQVSASYRFSSSSVANVWVLPQLMSELFTWVSTTADRSPISPGRCSCTGVCRGSWGHIPKWERWTLIPGAVCCHGILLLSSYLAVQTCTVSSVQPHRHSLRWNREATRGTGALGWYTDCWDISPSFWIAEQC